MPQPRLKRTLYETHVGFSSDGNQLFQSLLHSDRRWSALNFDEVRRGRESARYPAHDVPGGICHLASAVVTNVFDALSYMRTARQIVGATAFVRAEIERVILQDDISGDIAEELPEALGPGFSAIGTFPRFESHISLRRADRQPIVSKQFLAELVDQPNSPFSEVAIANSGSKVICTAFFDSSDEMIRRTRAASTELRDRISEPLVIKASLEQILCCTSFV